MPDPVVLKKVLTGLPFSGTDYNNNMGAIEASFADISPYVSSGLVPTIGTGLSVNVSSGTAVIGAHLAPASFVIGGLTPSTTVHLYLLQNGTGASNTTGTAPAGGVKLGTAVTGVATVTSVNTLRSSGRQVFVRPESQVPGAVGSMGSINLANWAAAAADNVPVFGGLPAGAITLPANVFLKDTNPQTLSEGVNIAVGTATGTKIGTATNQKIGFYNATPVVQQTGGVATAGGTYTATEQGMIQRAYDALRAYGLIT